MCYNLYFVARKLVQRGFFKKQHTYWSAPTCTSMTCCCSKLCTKGSRMSEKEVQLKFLSNIIQRQDVAFVTGITRRSRHKKRVHYLQVGPHGGNQWWRPPPGNTIIGCHVLPSTYMRIYIIMYYPKYISLKCFVSKKHFCETKGPITIEDWTSVLVGNKPIRSPRKPLLK